MAQPVDYEHIDLNLTRAACNELLCCLGAEPRVNVELENLYNELRARLQHDTPDPNADNDEEWLDT